MMFRIVGLICALGIDASDCQRPTARSIVRLGQEASELACARSAMMYGAGNAVVASHAPDEWVKFVCERIKPGR